MKAPKKANEIIKYNLLPEDFFMAKKGGSITWKANSSCTSADINFEISDSRR